MVPSLRKQGELNSPLHLPDVCIVAPSDKEGAASVGSGRRDDSGRAGLAPATLGLVGGEDGPQHVLQPAYLWHADRRALLLKDEAVRDLLRESGVSRRTEALVSAGTAAAIVVVHAGTAIVLKQLAEASAARRTLSLPMVGLVAATFAAAASLGAQCAFLLQALNHELSHAMSTAFDFRRLAYSTGLFLGASGAALCHVPWAAYYFSGSHLRHHRYAGSPRDVDADAIFFLWQPSLQKPLLRYCWLSVASVAVPVTYSMSLLKYSVKDIRTNALELTLFVSNYSMLAGACAVAGPFGASYLLLSSFFSMGLLGHPLVGFWLLQHLCIDGKQPTVSYYGSKLWNTLCLNELLHVEHHDFANVGWRYLPKLCEVKPDLYKELHFETSIFGLIGAWLRNEDIQDFACRARLNYNAKRSSARARAAESRQYRSF